MELAQLVDYAKSLDCIHCGLCLRTCPTYRLSGVESSGPRGRIHLMRSVAEGELAPDGGFAEEMQFCLLCRNCESVCPSGVRFGAMMETTRAALARGEGGARPALHVRAARWLGFRALLPHRLALSLFAGTLRLAQRSGLLTRLAPLFGERGRAAANLPPVPPRTERALLPTLTPAEGPRRSAVAMLEGCVMPELYGRVNRDTVALLSAAGYESRTAPGHVCCGALHAHNGDLEGARALARGTITSFDALVDGDGAPLPVVVNSAGCGAHMKAYGHLLRGDTAWRERAALFAARVQDLSELLAPEAERLELRLAPGALAGKVAYDDPCHLCHGQGVRAQPRVLLDRIAGLERVELPESEGCCGSAGIYSVLRPADSQAVFARKLEALAECGARVLVTANPGCQLQWESGLARAGSPVRVLHLAELLARALPEDQRNPSRPRG